LEVTVFPLRSLCMLPTKAEVRLGASCVWSMLTLPRLRLPIAALPVAIARLACKPDRPPTSAVPRVSMRLSAAQAMKGMLIAR